MTDKQKYVNVSMTRDSAQALRDHAAKHNVMIRDAALDMARLMENRETLLFEASDALGATQDKLAASEEARLLAEKVACDNAYKLGQAQQDAALWQSRAEQISQDSAAEVNDLSRRLTEAEEARRVAEESAHSWRAQSAKDQAVMHTQADLIDEAQDAAAKWKAECERHRSITAWDHVRAAVRKEPGIAWVPVLGLLAIAAAAVIRGMI